MNISITKVIIWIILFFFIGINIGFEVGKRHAIDLIIKLDKYRKSKK